LDLDVCARHQQWIRYGHVDAFHFFIGVGLLVCVVVVVVHVRILFLGRGHRAIVVILRHSALVLIMEIDVSWVDDLVVILHRNRGLDGLNDAILGVLRLLL
jgi:hypothetical protein